MKSIFHIVEDNGDYVYNYTAEKIEDGLIRFERSFTRKEFYEIYHFDTRNISTTLMVDYKTGAGEGQLVIPCNILYELPVVAALIQEMTGGKTFNNVKIFGGEPIADLFKERT